VVVSRLPPEGRVVLRRRRVPERDGGLRLSPHHPEESANR
jgi:hypothetical protein